MNRRGRERRGRPAPAPVERRTAYALAEVVADPRRPSARTLLLDGREAGQVDLADPRRLEFAYMRRIADLIDAFRPPGDGARRAPRRRRRVRAGRATSRPRGRARASSCGRSTPASSRSRASTSGCARSPRLRVKVGDAAELIRARPDRSADLVIGDAFDGPRRAGAALDGGVRRAGAARAAARRRVRAQRDRRAAAGRRARARRACCAAAFAHVAWVAPPGVLRGRAPGNVVLLASGVPLPLAALQRAATAAVPREQVLER